MLATGKGTAMGLTRKRMLELMGAAAAGSVAASLTSSTAGASAGGPVIRRDVCVIGGGSAGTYTAVRLGDLGASVVVVESKNRLGGHTETHHDPATGGTVDIGVIVFEDDPLVHAYFDRFGVELVPIGGGGGVGAARRTSTSVPADRSRTRRRCRPRCPPTTS